MLDLEAYLERVGLSGAARVSSSAGVCLVNRRPVLSVTAGAIGDQPKGRRTLVLLVSISLITQSSAFGGLIPDCDLDTFTRKCSGHSALRGTLDSSSLGRA